MLVGESKFPYSTFVQDADTYPHVRSPYVLLPAFPCHPFRTAGQFNRCFSYAVHQRQVNMRLFVVSFIVALVVIIMNSFHRPYTQSQDVVSSLRRDGAVWFVVRPSLRACTPEFRIDVYASVRSSCVSSPPCPRITRRMLPALMPCPGLSFTNFLVSTVAKVRALMSLLDPRAHIPHSPSTSR